MANKQDARSKADERFERARKTHDEAMSVIDQERAATKKKTERLRALRLAKEAESDVTASHKKPSRKSAKAKRKA